MCSARDADNNRKICFSFFLCAVSEGENKSDIKVVASRRKNSGDTENSVRWLMIIRLYIQDYRQIRPEIRPPNSRVSALLSNVVILLQECNITLLIFAVG